MAPKRKRTDRASFDSQRPSPHRPEQAGLAQHDEANRGRGRSQRGFPRRDSLQGSNSRTASNPANGSPAPRRVGSTQMPPTPTTPSNPSSPSLIPKPPLFDDAGALDHRYDNLTRDRLRNWAERGRSEVIEHGCQSRDDEDITELSSLFQEFIHAVIDSRLDPADAGACVRQILSDAPAEPADAVTFAPHTLFLDSLAIVMETTVSEPQPSLQIFLEATGVSVSLMRQVLDAPILNNLGLIRDNFARVGVRQATNLLYRQANYNLLREETEGYAKLTTELYLDYELPLDEATSPEIVRETFERVKALIGTFDLDVGRVLDVTLDAAAALLVKQAKFFIKFLRVSSWWPRAPGKAAGSIYAGGLPTWAAPNYPQWSNTEEDERANVLARMERDVHFWDRAREIKLAAYFELGGRQAVPSVEQVIAEIKGLTDNDASAIAEKKWIETTKTLPPTGNRVAAQLLGFKLLFYYSDARDATDVLPANLLYLAALLIKIGFISLPDLYPHLSPDDAHMDKVKENKMAEIEAEERKNKGGQMNALLMAGVLPQGDDETPAGNAAARREAPKKAEPEAKPAAPEADAKSKEPHEQKVSLLIQLLTIGALPEALFILGRFPWIPEVFPDVLYVIHRIAHVSLQKVYQEARPVSTMPTQCPTKNIPDPDQSNLPKGNVRLSRLTPKKQLKWPTPDRYDFNDSQDYRYYWDEWTDNVPVCQTVDDLFAFCETFLNLSGVNIGRDEALLAKIAVIGAKSLAEDHTDANKSRWLDLIRRLLLPALSLTKANGSAVNAIWNLVQQYPITTRYNLYAEWFEGQISRLPAMKSAFAQAQADTRATMKRVSLTNLSEMAKQLAKTSFSSPGIVFRVAFEQLESYPNLIEAFVECAKYFTNLSYDVLIWSLLNSLGKSRSRTQAEHALTTSKWLQALSKFTGKVLRRYSNLSPLPVLRYVNHQLAQGNSTDLIILKEFISSMGGIVDTADFTDAQILSMAGGEFLRKQTLIRGQDRRFSSGHSSQRLVKALTDSKLAAQLLLNLAQFRQTAIFKIPEDEAHIKYLSSLIDDTHQILLLYLDFLWTNLDPATFDQLVPSISELLDSFGLDNSLAFLIGRASLSHRIRPWKPKSTGSKNDDNKSTEPVVDGQGDAVMAEPEEVITDTLTTEGTPPAASQKSDEQSQIRAALQPIVDSVQARGSSELWQRITPELVVTFWTLQLGDIYCPDQYYRQERERLKAEEAALSRDRSDMSERGRKKKLDRRSDLMKLWFGVNEEFTEHQLRKGRWKLYLNKLFQSSFPEPRASADAIADALLEQCFLPRVLLSPADAEYTFRFIKALHDWNAPGFKLMSLYDRLFNSNRLRTLIFTCTVREADYLGRFLKLILEDLSRWHKNEPVAGDKVKIGAYDKEGKGPADSPRLGFALTVDDNGRPLTFVEHDQFRDTLYQWHKNLNMALKSCLAGTEWMHIRNALTVLKTVLDFFPAIDFMAKQFSAQLQNITRQEAASKTAVDGEEAHRVDLSVAAQGALSELQRRSKKWMIVQAFRSNKGAQAEDKSSHLRATAPEFKPDTNQSVPKPPVVKQFPDQPSRPSNRKQSLPEEDGEVADSVSKPVGTPRPVEAQKDSLPPKPVQRDTPRRDEATPPTRPSAPARGGQNQHPGNFRHEPRPNTLPDRPPLHSHNLPSRPDVPIPGPYNERFNQPRNPDRPSPREPRGPRDSRDTRESRDSRNPRDNIAVEPKQPDRSHADRRAGDGGGRDGRGDQSSRHGHDRDRGPRDSRGRRPLGPEPTAPPAPASSASAAQEPSMNPERAALFRQDNQVYPRGNEPDQSGRGRPAPADSMSTVNPERAALIKDTEEGTPTRGPRDDGRRNHSPRRQGRHNQGHGHQDQGQPADQRPAARNRGDQSPSHRGDRPRDGDRGAERNRDSSGFHRPDYDFQPGPDREESSYGRLNPVPPADVVPSGPRGRGRNSTRPGHPSGPGPARPEARFGHDNQRPSTPDMHAPSGPAGPSASGPSAPSAPSAPAGPVGPAGPSASGSAAPGPAPTGPSAPSGPTPTGPSAPSGRNRRPGYDSHSANQTPTGTPQTTAADRIRSFNANMDMSPPSGVHPDRLAHMGPNSGSIPPPPPPPPGGPQPRGPSRHSTPSKPQDWSGPLAQADPNFANGGPGSTERSRTGSRRQLAGINNMLQANKPDPQRSSSINNAPRRGQPQQHQRQTLGGSDAQVLTGGSPAAPVPERQDPPRPGSGGRGANGDEGSRDGHDRGRRDRDGRQDRPSRSSHRENRDREQERGSGRDKEGKEHREYRDRRSGGGLEGGSTNRDDREGRRSGRSGRDNQGQSGSGPRDGRHRGGDGPQGPKAEEEWGSMRGSRGPPRDGGSRQDDRREDRGRKRRGEESGGNMTNDREKRTRR